MGAGGLVELPAPGLVGVKMELRGYDDIVAKRGYGLSDDALVVAPQRWVEVRRVGLGGIEERTARIMCGADGVDGVVMVGYVAITM